MTAHSPSTAVSTVALNFGLESLERRALMAAAAISHDYELNGNASDALGGPSLTTNGGTFTSSTYDFAAGKGLTGNNVVDSSEYSIEIKFKYNADVTTSYKKIIDFKNLTDDQGVYQSGQKNYFYNTSGQGPTTVALGTTQTFVITRDAATKTVTGYTNGVQQWSFVDTTSAATFSATNKILQLFRDDRGGSEQAAGSVDRVRIYKGVLTAAEVTSLNNGGTPPGGGAEAEVRGNNVVINDNDTTASATDGTDFGTTPGGAGVTRTFTVKNTGVSALTTSGLTVPSGYSIVEGLSSSIAAGSSDTFTVKLNAAAAGTYSGNISFASNDADENPYNFAVKGVVNTPTFSLVNGVLTVTGTAGNDYIRGSVASDVLTMKVNGLSQTFGGVSGISRIVVNALGGNDLILLSQSITRATSLNGGDGNDTIYGGGGADVINGGSGDDSAFKGAGDSLTLVEEILN